MNSLHNCDVLDIAYFIQSFCFVFPALLSLKEIVSGNISSVLKHALVKSIATLCQVFGVGIKRGK